MRHAPVSCANPLPTRSHSSFIRLVRSVSLPPPLLLAHGLLAGSSLFCAVVRCTRDATCCCCTTGAWVLLRSRAKGLSRREILYRLLYPGSSLFSLLFIFSVFCFLSLGVVLMCRAFFLFLFYIG